MSASRVRTRIRSVFGTGSVHFTHDRYAPNPPVSESSNTYVSPQGIREEMTDFVTPNFRVLSSQGYIVNNRMSRFSDRRMYSTPTLNAVITHGLTPGSVVYNWSGNTGLMFDDIAIGPWYNYAPRADLESRTLTTIDELPLQKSAAYSARNRISPIYVQSLVSLAEMHKTIDMIVNVASTLRNLRRALIRNASPSDIYQILGGKVKKATTKSKSLDPITNRWLEYRYGWTPLVMELQGALKALDKSRNIKLRGTARGKAIKSFTSETSLSNRPLFNASPAFGNVDLLFTQHERVECRSYVLFEVSKDFQTARDFGFTEVPLAMWELVPFSFVVDWFIPIGDWLEAVTPKLGVTILAEGITTRRSTQLQRRVTAWHKVIAGLYSFDVDGTDGLIDSRDYQTFVRSPKLSDVLYAFPSIDVKLNVKRAIDSLALLNQTRNPRHR